MDLPGVQCLYIRVFIKRHKHLGFALTSEIQNKHISKQSYSLLLFPFCKIIFFCFCLKTQMKTGGNNQSELWIKHLTFDFLLLFLTGNSNERRRNPSEEHAMRLLDVAFIPAGQFIMSAFSLKCLRHFRNKIEASFVNFLKSVSAMS